jgi:hypothetical protein
MGQVSSSRELIGSASFHVCSAGNQFASTRSMAAETDNMVGAARGLVAFASSLLRDNAKSVD